MTGISPLSSAPLNPYTAQATSATAAPALTQTAEASKTQVTAATSDRDNDGDKGATKPDKADANATFGPAVNVTLSPQAQAAMKAQGVG